MNIVTIKEVKGVVTCADDGSAEHVFNVKNATDGMLRIGLQISGFESEQAQWLTIDGPTERELEIDTMTQVSVAIQAPPECAPGRYSYRLRAFDRKDPGERFTDGETVYFEVPEKPVEPAKKPTKKPLNWLIPAAIAAGVVLVAVIIFLVVRPGSKDPNPDKVQTARFGQSKFDNATFK